MNSSADYFVVVPVLPPTLPLPLVPGNGAGTGAGVGTVVVAEPPVVALPEAPAPAPARASRWQFSRSAPSRPAHLVRSTPPDAPAEPDTLVSLLPDIVPPAAGAVVLEEAPAEPDAPALVPEPVDCANVAPERARSAAAVAAVSTLSVICEIS